MEELTSLIMNYKTPQRAVELINSTKIVLLSGITGAGKDTIKKRLLVNPKFQDIVSHTTRLPRENSGVLEVEGLDYHFINQAAAVKMLENNQLIEAKLVHGTIYGTSIAELESINSSKRIAITDLDVQGVAEYKAVSSSVVAIFVVPPDYQTWRERLKARYSLNDLSVDEWAKRRDSAIKELNQALSLDYFHFVINGELHQSVDDVLGILSLPDIEQYDDNRARLLAGNLLQEIRGFFDVDK